MNRILLVSGVAIVVIIVIGVASFFVGGNPVVMLHGSAWKAAYQRCLGAKGATATEIPAICGSLADTVSVLDSSSTAHPLKPLPFAFEPRRTYANAPGPSPADAYASLLARDARIFRSPKAASASGDIDQSLPVGKDQLLVVAGCPDEPEHPDFCQTLVWRGKKLLSDRYITIIGAFPSSGIPALVNVTNSNGGNCCVPTANIIDLTQPEPVVLPLKTLGDDLRFDLISSTIVALFGTDTVQTDSDGDPLTATYLYHLDRKLLVSAPFDGRTDFGAMVDANPGQLLADPVFRKPLSDVLGERLKEFRQYVSVSSPGQLVNYRYLIGQGCVAHACNEAGGMYVIDIATGEATAVWSDRGAPLQIAGKSPTDPDVRQILRKWLIEAGELNPDE